MTNILKLKFAVDFFALLRALEIILGRLLGS
jgi:hypothetical protein